MADINPLPPPPKPNPPAPSLPPRPASPMPTPLAPTTQPQRPITPPTGLQVKNTNMGGLSPSPSQSAPAPLPPKPTPPTLPPQPPASTGFKSSIRTMEEDLAQLKQGGQPIKTPTPAPIATPIPAPLPKPTVNPISIPPSPIKPAMPAPPRPISVPPKSISVPSSVTVPTSGGGSSKKWLIIILLIALLGGLGAWFFLFRDSGESEIIQTTEPTFLATPEPTATPTPTPLTFSEIFQPNSNVTYTSTVAKTAMAELEVSVNQQVVSVGELKTLKVTDAQGNQKNFAQFVADLKLTIPANVMSGLDPTQFYYTVFGKPDGKNGRGIIIKIQDRTKLDLAMTAWEPTIPTNLKDLLKITLAKSASTTFLGSTYQTVAIRYRNFPDAFNTIDYAVIQLKNGESYLVITNTRDHIFAIIDRAVGSELGK